MCDVITVMRAEKFSNNRSLDLKSMGNGNGVRHLTIRNTGAANLIIADSAQETIPPGSTFAINSNLLVANDSFDLEFDNSNPALQKEAIVRYLVDICE